ncbi:MAG: MBL fold metallo-hydrolase [Desulfurococcales archaeon]|nr:MBL fold metallo-hydrolase [Desulfurococcales archaeon]
MQPVKIARGVYQLLGPGVVYPFDSTVFYVETDNGYFIVDTGSGMPGSPEAIISSLIQIGVNPRTRKPKAVIATHSHIYNAGGLFFFHRYYKTIIMAHQLDAPALESGDPALTASKELGVKFKPVPVGHVIKEPSTTIDGLVILHTPGHTPGSISVVAGIDEKVMLIGDALGRLKDEWKSSEADWQKTFDLISRKIDYDVLCTSLRCYRGYEIGSFLKQVEEEGPVWLP